MSRTGVFESGRSSSDHETLEGRRWFPFQWRVAGPWLVYLTERATRVDPHLIDVAIKVVALAGSTLILMRFTKRWTSPLGAIVAGALYLVLTSAGFATEGYSIYYTNDYLLMLGWFAAVELLADGRVAAAAVVTFLTAWAKETIGLVPLFLVLGWTRGRVRGRDLALCAIAFAIPTLFLRWFYPAPFKYLMWWGNIERNVPFIRLETDFILLALRNCLKVLMFFNVLWLLAARGFTRTSDLALRDLAYVGTLYLAGAFVVVYVRELRHFLPLAIIVLPLAVAEIERLVAADRTRC